MIYDGVINKPPLNEETLAHYGVLGMKWGVRKNPEKAFSKAAKELAKRKKKVDKAAKRYNRALNRPFGSLYRSTSQKLNKLNKKKAKLDKWEKAIDKVYDKEGMRILKDKKSPTGYSIDALKTLKLNRLSKAYKNAGLGDNKSSNKKKSTASDRINEQLIDLMNTVEGKKKKKKKK